MMIAATGYTSTKEGRTPERNTRMRSFGSIANSKFQNEFDVKHIPRMLSASGAEPDKHRRRTPSLWRSVLTEVCIAIVASRIELMISMRFQGFRLECPQNTGHCVFLDFDRTWGGSDG